ncbi:MAG: peptidoglycan bridge formation glycyltransferase FemA/FemB family protein [Clostridia bacterium]|nr:peptidoglycan bridge formation glycyltransferase FemA/FemB family protein [Clostridia bacterium]
MNYIFDKETDLTAFENFVLTHGGNYLHSEKWARVKTAWKSYFFSGRDDKGDIVLTALVLERNFPGAGRIWYIPSGACCDHKNEELFRSFSAFMKNQLKSNHITALFYDPLIPNRINGEDIEEGKAAHKLFTENGFQLNADASKTLYKSPLQLITRLQSETGEKYTPEKLLKTFEKGVRYSVRVGEARGLVHRIYTIEDVERDPQILEDFLSVMSDTSERNNFLERDGEYCKHLLKVFGKDGFDIMLVYYDKNKDNELQAERLKRKEELLTALETAPEKKKRGITEEIDSIDKQTEHYEERRRETENTDKDLICVSGGMTLHYGNMSSCIFGGSRNLLRNNLRASHFFNFKRICHSIEKGSVFHDLGYVLLDKTPVAEDGTLGKAKPNSEFEGILAFKKSFGSDEIEYVGEYIMVGNRLLFFSYSHLLDKAKHFIGLITRILRKLK